MGQFLSSIAPYFLAGFVGFFIGVVCSCFLLAKRNLERAKKMEDSVENSIKLAKENYRRMTEKKSDEPLYYEEIFEASELEEGNDYHEKSPEDGVD